MVHSRHNFKKKLKILSDSRLIGNYSTSLPPWMVGLVVFGGTDPISGVVVSCSAFDMGFSKEQNCAVWEKCGAAPLTRTCLQNNSQVRREIGDDDDAANTAMTRIQESNNVSTHFCHVMALMEMFSKIMLKRLAESQ